ncbi:MAG: ornithine carbamoyltransferase [Baekduia sp.]
MRHLLTGDELSEDAIEQIVSRAVVLKGDPFGSQALAARTVALIFQKPSTRTRISFEVGITELGGRPMLLNPVDLQLGRGESLRDTARVLGRHVTAVGIRTHADSELTELASEDQLPVFNMLTERYHPCQALADLLTLREEFGRLDGLKVAYVGDANNNVARSLASMCRRVGIEVAFGAPEGYVLDGETAYADPREAVAGAHAVYTDVWVSMGDEETAEQRRADLAPYQIDDALLDAADDRAVALHCLPAHPGEEIAAEVLYGDRQRIWDQAENRRHAQKAMLEWLIR